MIFGSTPMERALEALVVKSAVLGREVVALCWADGHVEELTNTADIAVARVRFDIDGTEVRFALLRNVDRGKPAMLWHTHFGGVEPSVLDIEAFPNWLVEVGVIHHVPTGNLAYYDQDGVKISTSGLDSSHLATQEI